MLPSPQFRVLLLIPLGSGCFFKSLPPPCPLTETADLHVISNERIYGGSEARAHQFPWMASFQVKGDKKLQHFCGGSLINHRWILTAAHCFQTFKTSSGPSVSMDKLVREGRIKIFLGIHRNDIDPKTVEQAVADPSLVPPGQLWLHAIYFKNHPDYVHTSQEKVDPRISEYDFCVVKTSQYVEFIRNKLQPVFVPKSRDEFKGVESSDVFLVMGWGYLGWDDGAHLPSDVLKVAHITMVDCHRRFRGIDLYCYTSTDVQGYPCSGDSGSSLIGISSNREHGSKAVIISVVSTGSGTCGSGPSGDIVGYSPVDTTDALNKWIKKEAEDGNCPSRGESSNSSNSWAIAFNVFLGIHKMFVKH